MTIMRRPCAMLSILCLVAALDARAADLVDSPMYRDPDLPLPPILYHLPDRTKALWLRALDRPETDTKCKAAGAIAEARRRGLKGLETTIVPLRTVLDRPDEPLVVRLAVARALVELDARDAAPSLLKQARAGSGDLRELIEPALARWDHAPARTMWLERLADPETTPRTLVLAIRGLAAVREARAVDRLRELALSDRTPVTVRLEAAQALGGLRDGGLETDATRLMAAGSRSDRLVAANLLRRHTSKEAIDLLKKMVGDSEPAVAALAIGRLIEIDPALGEGWLGPLLASKDAKLRSHGVEILLRRPSEKHVRLLGDRLDDVHLEVRTRAREALEQLARKDLRTAVIAEGTRLLGTSQWRAQEQATILLARLEHGAAAKRLVELLSAPRPEVFLTAAWGLRKLAVADTLEAVTSHVGEELARRRKGKTLAGREALGPQWVDLQLSQLNQLLGNRKYAPADGLMRRFVPRADPLQIPEARAAAIHALGLIHAGKADAGLAGALTGRLHDTLSMPPEDQRVRLTAAFALGRVKVKSTVADLKKYCGSGKVTQEGVNNACLWAIAEITGEPMPRPMPETIVPRNWFLVPTD